MSEHLRQQMGPATGQWRYELVAEDEEPAATVAREIREESGHQRLGEAEHRISFGQVIAGTEVCLWRAAEKVGEPPDTEEVGRLA
ncbi:NUDIX hydrolase [Amycolatopsis panacis]|uniref:hypothetical protein n=1 Tax=Amycolatopsis panacis TaxID=2340917 RepID=UPI001F32C1F9|nr:hypothetical protein [Amycolatopsis panacis]